MSRFLKSLLITIALIGFVAGAVYVFTAWQRNFALRGGLDVGTNIPANVYVDGALKGETVGGSETITLKDLPIGQRMIKLTAKDASKSASEEKAIEWSKSVMLHDSTNAWVVWNLQANEASQSGYVISLEKMQNNKNISGGEVTVISNPGGAKVQIDGKDYGASPVSINDIAQGDHVFTISQDGYETKEARVAIFAKYSFQADFTLSRIETPAPLPIIQSEVLTNNAIAQITILNTPTGWLRVRSEAGFNGKEITKVNPGEKYSMLEEKSGWVKIRLSDGSDGWVSSTYVNKQ